VNSSYVIYARYSSDLQSPESIADQARKCREFARREGLNEIGVYEDAATSGVGTDRRGFQRLMADASSPSRPFSIILVDDTSRLSRSLPDVVNVHQRLAFLGIRVIAVSQGIDTQHEQSELLVTMHGLVDGIYVKELSKKTHRGLEGKAIKGLSTGGRCYGYDAVPVEAGGTKWQVNEGEAAVVREIFESSARGASLKAITAFLNARKVPPPQKRADRPHPTWCPTAIRAMLRRELYIGQRIWNQTKFVKAPGTNRRVARPRPRSEWHVMEVPELRIISDELWNRVQTRQKALHERYAAGGAKPVSRGAYSPYLLSGFIMCGSCGAKMIIVSGGKGRVARYGCPQAFNRSACPNRLSTPHDQLETMFFEKLQRALLAPCVLTYLVDALMRAQQKKDGSRDGVKRSRELRMETDRLVAAIASVGHSDALLKSLKEKEEELLRLHTEHAEQKTLTRDEITSAVAERLQSIPALLAKNPQAAKAKLAQHVDSITLIPQSEGHYIAEGEWDPLGDRGLQMVAGAGFEPATFGL
jgi:site-specific DNA recombinase